MNNIFIDTQKIDAETFFDSFKIRVSIISIGIMIFEMIMCIFHLLISTRMDFLNVLLWFLAIGPPMGVYISITFFFSRGIFLTLTHFSQVIYELDENLLRIQVKGEKLPEDIKEFSLKNIKQAKLKLNYFAIPIVPYVRDTLDINNRYSYSQNYVLRPGKKIEIRGTDYHLQITPSNNHDFLYQLHERLKQIINPALIECSYNLENKIKSIKVHEH